VYNSLADSTRTPRLPRHPNRRRRRSAAALQSAGTTYPATRSRSALEVQYFGAFPRTSGNEEQLLADYASVRSCRCSATRVCNAGRGRDDVHARTATWCIPTAKCRIQILCRARGLPMGTSSATEHQFRGGTGISRQARLRLISNQIEHRRVDGVRAVDTTTRGRSADTERYKPATVTAPGRASSGADRPELQFPQVWRTQPGSTQRLPGGWVGTLEYIYSQDVNGTYYINANLRRPTRPTLAQTRGRAGWAPTATASTRRSRTPSC